MRHLRVAAVCLALLGLCAIPSDGLAGAPPPIPTNPWVEVGDAGDLSTPQLLVGSGYDGITGNIGGSDLVDVFGFHWTGGAIEFGPSAGLFLSLYDFDGTTKLFGESANVLPIVSLPAGDYLFKVAISAGLPDPPFTVGTFTINPSGPALISEPTSQRVPAPAGMWLLGSALAGLAAVAWRRRRV